MEVNPVVEFSGRLSKAPIVYALCHIQFAPVLKMRDFVPDIQDQLRGSYENFDEEQLTGIIVQRGSSTPTVQSETRWRFESADSRCGFILQNSSLLFHTTNYTDFDEFVPEVVRGLDAVAPIAKVQNLQRVGLRYIDLIDGGRDIPVEELVHPQLRGFGKELNDSSEQLSQYIYMGATKLGTLALRVTRGTHKAPLPPDLLPLVLKPARQPPKTLPSVFFDTDHFVIGPKAGRTSEIESLVRELKVPIAAAFKKAITEKALARWK